VIHSDSGHVPYGLKEHIENVLAPLSLGYGCENGWRYEGKWYDHELDMAVISKVFPDVLFELSGEGEDKYDLWKKYFRSGQMAEMRGRIEYEEYDPEYLEEVKV
jgi:hypothetical protein